MNLKILIYCTKGKPYLIKNRFSGQPYLAFKELEQDVDYAPQLERIKLNGKIVAECDYGVNKIYGNIKDDDEPFYDCWLTEKSQLNHDELVARLKSKGLKLKE